MKSITGRAALVRLGGAVLAAGGRDDAPRRRLTASEGMAGAPLALNVHPWYAGVGLDWHLAERWYIGPLATYEQVGLSVPTETWLFGVGLTYAR